MKKQGRQAESYASAPDQTIRYSLAFGRDGAPVDETANALIAGLLKAIRDPVEHLRMDADDLKNDPGALETHLFSPSLFGERKLVDLRITKETEGKPLLELLEATKGTAPEGWLVVRCGDLTAKSKLRAAFDKPTDRVLLHLFERSDRDFEAWVLGVLREANVRIEPDAQDALMAVLMKDQALARTELDKLVLSAEARDEPLSRAEIGELIALEDASSHFELIDLALDGNVPVLATRLETQVHDAAQAIPTLIGLSNQVKRLLAAHQLSSEGITGKAIGDKLKPRVFERQWPAFQSRMSTWSPDRCLALLSRIGELDIASRRASSPQDAFVRKLLLDVAVSAQSGRRRR